MNIEIKKEIKVENGKAKTVNRETENC